MIITLSPITSNQDDTPPNINDEAITYRGETYDLSQLPIGGEVQASDPFVGKIKRDDEGVIRVTLLYRYCTEKAEPMQSTDINDYIFDVASGQCPDPIVKRSEQNEY